MFRRVLRVNKRTIFFLWGLVMWMLHFGWARHAGPGTECILPGQLSIEFVDVGGWAEHRLIPSRVRSIGHQLRKAGH